MYESQRPDDVESGLPPSPPRHPRGGSPGSPQDRDQDQIPARYTKPANAKTRPSPIRVDNDYAPWNPQDFREPRQPPSFAESGWQSRSEEPTLASGAPSPFKNGSEWSQTTTPIEQSHVSLQDLLPPGSPPSPDSDSVSVSKEWAGHSNIEFLGDRDDAEIRKGWRRRLFFLAPFLTLVSTGLYLLYLGLRVACVTSAQRLRHTVYGQAWVFIAVEMAVAVPSLLHNVWTMWALKKRNRPMLRLRGNQVPSVDVFITCCGEDDDLVLDTVRGACNIDYPQEQFRVIVLDDGGSDSLGLGVKALGSSYPNVLYWSREKRPDVPHHFKAGNLNYGLEETRNMDGGAGEYMAALDADMIPEPCWLRAVLPHLIADDKMALACPPQLFYNTPTSDPLAQSLDFFVHVIEPIKDALGVAWCTGSGYVVRRTALDSIGNFPLGSLAEDVATSTLMLGRGWKTAYVHEPLQFGTVPEDYGGHLKQRTRWAIGTVDTSIKLNFCLWGASVREMTAAQRFSGFLYAALSLYTILLTVSLFAIPVILVMGKPLVAFADLNQLRWLLRACFAAFMSNRLCEFSLFAPSGYHTGQRGSRYQLWMAPYISLCIIRAFVLPTWLGGKAQAFKPTGAQASSLEERVPGRRKPMRRRLWAILFNFMAVFHLSYVYLTLTGVALTCYRTYYRERAGGDVAVLTGMLTHAFWPPLTFVFICSSLWTPISYAVDPPAVPERERLLERDPKTGVARPAEMSKKIAFGGQAAWFELEYTLATVYTCLVFAASFFLF